MSMLSTNIIFFAILSLTFYKLIIRTLRSIHRRSIAIKHLCLPANRLPQIDKILGTDAIMHELDNYKQKKYLASFNEKFVRYGDTWTLFAMGKVTYYSIDPMNVQAVLGASFSSFEVGSNRTTIIEQSIGPGILTIKGSAWQRARKLIQPGFHPRVIGRVNYEKYAQKLIEQITANGAGPIDLQPLFHRYTLDTTSDLIFGRSINSLDLPNGTAEAAEIEEAFTKILNRVEDLCERSYAAIWWPKAGSQDGMQRICEYIRNEVQKSIQKADKQHDIIEPSMCDLFTAKTQDVSLIAAQITHIFLPGRDTTAALLSNLFFELSRNQNAWNKLVSEIAILNGRAPERHELTKFRYLRHCLDEVLRMYPGVPYNSRRASRDVILPRGGGPEGQNPLLIREGEEIIFPVYSMHRQAKYFGPDTDDFVPERWEHIQPGWAFMPFGGGRRTCPGKHFAYQEASYVVIRILQHFSKIKSCSDQPWVEDFRALLSNASGCWISLEPHAESNLPTDFVLRQEQ